MGRTGGWQCFFYVPRLSFKPGGTACRILLSKKPSPADHWGPCFDLSVLVFLYRDRREYGSPARIPAAIQIFAAVACLHAFIGFFANTSITGWGSSGRSMVSITGGSRGSSWRSPGRNMTACSGQTTGSFPVVPWLFPRLPLPTLPGSGWRKRKRDRAGLGRFLSLWHGYIDSTREIP